MSAGPLPDRTELPRPLARPTKGKSSLPTPKQLNPADLEQARAAAISTTWGPRESDLYKLLGKIIPKNSLPHARCRGLPQLFDPDNGDRDRALEVCARCEHFPCGHWPTQTTDT